MTAIDLDRVPEYEISWKTLQVSDLDLSLMVQQLEVTEGPDLRASLERRQLTERWEKQLGIMGEVGLRHPSLDFEKRRASNLFTLRLNLQYRVLCTYEGNRITAIVAGTHDEMDKAKNTHALSRLRRPIPS